MNKQYRRRANRAFFTYTHAGARYLREAVRRLHIFLFKRGRGESGACAPDQYAPCHKNKTRNAQKAKDNFFHNTPFSLIREMPRRSA